tara:strand:- start:645 stop:878 length:234 start_codon:yes stop_codon:yes gene_type:complete
MANQIKQICFSIILNSTLFLMLVIGIQNSSNKTKVDLMINKTVDLPLSFILGMSFISGSLTGNILSLINSYKNKKIS